MTEKHYDIRVTDEEIQNAVSRVGNISKYFRDAAKFFEEWKEIINTDEFNLDRRYKELRNKKLELEVEIKRRELGYEKNFGTSPTKKGKQAIKIGVQQGGKQTTSTTTEEKTYDIIGETNQNPYDKTNDRLQCIECGELFTWNNDEQKLKAKNDYIDHRFKKENGVTLTEEAVLQIV